MGTSENLEATLSLLASPTSSIEPREVRAARAANVIRRAGGYRWVGLYDVLNREIAVIGWSGPTAPTHTRFPRDQGLNGAAVVSRAAVVVPDVSKDPRYLATLTDTRGEMIFPVSGLDGTVVGTIDVESDRVDAFGEADHALLERSARALRPLWGPAKDEAPTK
jgi:putative methionine-R-sulfoxide reductase with GAF domain